MTTYQFTAAVRGLATNDYEQLDRLFTNAFVIVPACIDGHATISVEVDAVDSLSAIALLEQHLGNRAPEVVIEGLEEDFVTTPEIAMRCGVSRETPRKWDKLPGFPRQRGILAGGVKIWTWAAVRNWIATHKPERIDPDEPLPLADDVVGAFNAGMLSSDTTSGSAVTYSRKPITSSGQHAVFYNTLVAHVHSVRAGESSVFGADLQALFRTTR